jgi:hypothetical protein
LAAAQALVERGFAVVVLEARDRAGGRCYTVDGIDQGAHWIHGTEGNPIITLARLLSVETLFVGGDSTYSGGWEQIALRGPRGRILSGEDKLTSILLADEVRDDLDTLRRRHLEAGAEDLSLREALSGVLARRSLSGADQISLNWHTALLARDDCAADEETLSLLWWDDGYEVYGYGDSVFLGGYGALVARLAAGLDVRLSHVVRSIDYAGRGAAPVRVVTDRGIFEGDAALVTLPLGVLKAGTVRFQPPLSGAKEAAINRMGMGTLTKVTARFSAPFWPREQYVFGCLSAPVSVRPTTVINLWKSHRLPVLQMMVGGGFGRTIEGWSRAQVRAWAIGILSDVFGEEVPEPVEVERTGWDRDPFSRGSYSYLAVGSTPADIEALAEPLADRIFFAGEATYRHHWAAAHGAYVSGLREAARLADDPSILPPRHFTENRRWREMMLRAGRFYNALSTSLGGAEIAERVAMLRDSEAFSAVPPNDLQVLAMMLEPVSFDEGEVLCRFGDRATHVYLVAEGEVEVRLADGSLTRVLRRGGVVGEYGLFGPGMRTATLVSRGRCRALRLDYQRFQRFLLAFPESALALLKLTVEHLLSRNPTARGDT